MTYRIHIQGAARRFSYYGVFADSVKAAAHGSATAHPGERVAVRLWRHL